MQTSETAEAVRTLRIVKEIEIEAPVAVAFQAMLAEVGPEGTMPDGAPFPMVLEAWPGGRWYRDLGDDAGHLWGHVQVIKPPTLLEIRGPTFMSYAATGHIQWRLTAEGRSTRLVLTHTAIGLLPDEAYKSEEGWEYKLEQIRKIAAGMRGGKGGR